MAGPPDAPRGRSQVGEYKLGDVVSEGARTRTYRAEQISVRRPVILEMIKPDSLGEEEVVENFLADVRAKAAVRHNGIGSVYEAVREDEAVFYTREALPGRTFEELHAVGESYDPATVAHMLEQVGTAMHHLEEREVATLPLEPRHLVLGDHEVVRMVNLAVADKRDAKVAGHDRHLVAELFLDFLQRGKPGATRAKTLLRLMTEDEGKGLTWLQVAHTSRKLAQELSEGAKRASQMIRSAPEQASHDPREHNNRALMALLVGVLVLAALGAAGFLLSNRKSPPEARDLDGMVQIPPGTYFDHAGKEVALERFWIDAHEVTVAEYAEFLAVLEELPADKRSGYDHPDQPSIKSGHYPDDWETMLTAARSASTFDGLPIDLNHPVVNVDWWDAHAFANWKGGRLPTQEEWFAASQDGTLKALGWGPVDGNEADVTSRGVHGLAGNVSEWVRDPSKNPAFPMNPKQPVTCGASYLDPRNGAKARQWPATREIRRNDLGFRVVRDRAP